MPSVRKVIDTSELRWFGPGVGPLEQFISESSDNIVVLSWMTISEMTKGNAAENFYRSTAILSRFAEQVEVLRPPEQAIKAIPDVRRLPDILIDEQQTAAMRSLLKLSRDGSNPGTLLGLAALGDQSARYHDLLTANAEPYRQVISEMAKAYSENDYKVLRNRMPFPQDLRHKILLQILANAEGMAVGALDVPRRKLPDFYYSLQFRFSVAIHANALWWITNSGHLGVKAKVLRNSFIDTANCAYATFFDGIICEDGQQRDCHDLARQIVQSVLRAL